MRGDRARKGARLATDHNFDARIVAGLLRRRPDLDILRIRDVGLAAAPDPMVLGWAAREGCSLLSKCLNERLPPLEGSRHVAVTERRTRVDWAHVVKARVDERYPDAEQIVLGMDNLNTPSPASLYEAFAPAEAKRIADKLEIHDTPTHGRWLNLAELELSVLSRQWLDQRLPNRDAMTRAVAAWEACRNRSTVPVTGASPPPTHASGSSSSSPHKTYD